MKNKRASFGAQIHFEGIGINSKQKQQIPTSSIQYRRKDDKGTSNKQNIIQITQPLEPHLQSVSSKQFILSRDSLNSTKNIGKFRQINLNQIQNIQQASKQNLRDSKPSLEFFDRRLSLKCSTNPSSCQKSQRMSMAPMRRESFVATSAFQTNDNDRDTSSITYHNKNTDSSKIYKNEVKKEAIITNFMNKLEHQEDLRSIIESKLKVRDHKQSYYCEGPEESSQMAMKLKQCESQIKYFKSMIREMAEKISILTEQKNNSTIRQNSTKADYEADDTIQTMTYIPLQKRNTQGSSKYHPEALFSMKKCKDASVQTVSFDNKMSDEKNRKQPFDDFFENLQKTIKVLDGKKS